MQRQIDTVADVTSDYNLVLSRESVMHVLDHLDVDTEKYRHGRMFVRTQNGEYTGVLWFKGVVPSLHKNIKRLV